MGVDAPEEIVGGLLGGGLLIAHVRGVDLAELDLGAGGDSKFGYFHGDPFSLEERWPAEEGGAFACGNWPLLGVPNRRGPRNRLTGKNRPGRQRFWSGHSSPWACENIRYLIYSISHI